MSTVTCATRLVKDAGVAYWGRWDGVVGVVVCKLGAQVLVVGLAEPHVVLDEYVPAGQLLAVGHAHVGRGHLGVVQVEGLDVHPRRARSGESLTAVEFHGILGDASDKYNHIKYSIVNIRIY